MPTFSRSISPSLICAAEGAVVEIIIRVVGPLLVVIGLFWFAHGAGFLTSPYNAAMVDYGAAVVAAGFALVWLGWQ